MYLFQGQSSIIHCLPGALAESEAWSAKIGAHASLWDVGVLRGSLTHCTTKPDLKEKSISFIVIDGFRIFGGHLLLPISLVLYEFRLSVPLECTFLRKDFQVHHLYIPMKDTAYFISGGRNRRQRSAAVTHTQALTFQ